MHAIVHVLILSVLTMTNTCQQCHDVPSYLHPFLTDSGSLTKKLKKITGSAVVNVLSGEFKSPDWWSQYVLKLQCDKLFQREILMTSDEFSCWYARSYIPASTWYLYTDFFKQLSSKNLSDILFNNRFVERVNSDFFEIGTDDVPYHWLAKHMLLDASVLWMKLSEFSLNKQANFYLSEIFLPELKTCLQQSGQPIGG